MATLKMDLNFLFRPQGPCERAARLVIGHTAMASTARAGQHRFSLAAHRAQAVRFLNSAKMHILIYSRNPNWPQANNNCMRIFHLAPSSFTPFREKTAALKMRGREN